MARPSSSGLDYFPLDIDIDQDDKVALIESDFGIKGFGVIIKLLMKIYSTSYHYEWGEKEQKLFSRRVNVDINDISDIVNASLKWGIFDETLHNQYQVLTSRGIQKRYFEACTRRKEVEYDERLLLLTANELKKYKNLVNVPINTISTIVNVNINPNSTNENVTPDTQSKVKESRVEESKVNNSNDEEKEATPADNDLNELDPHFFYQNNFGIESPFISQSIEMWIEDLSAELVLEAMKRAVIDQKGFKYAEGIMKKWDAKNIKTLDQVHSDDVAFSNQKERKSYSAPFGNKQPVRKEKLPDWAQEGYQAPKETPVSPEVAKDIEERLERLRKLQKNQD